MPPTKLYADLLLKIGLGVKLLNFSRIRLLFWFCRALSSFLSSKTSRTRTKQVLKALFKTISRIFAQAAALSIFQPAILRYTWQLTASKPRTRNFAKPVFRLTPLLVPSIVLLAL